MHRKKWTVTVSIALILGLVAAGCTGRAEDEGGDEIPDTITFGAALPLTGGLSPEGKKQRRGYELWREMVNEQGGIQIGERQVEVEIKYYDYESETDRAVSLTERLVTQDDVDLLFGVFGSGDTAAVSAVTERYGIPMIAPTASSEEVFTEEYDYLFGIFTPNDTLTEPLTEIALEQDPPVESIAIVSRNDLFPLAIGTEAEASAEDAGIEVLRFEEFAPGSTDHSGALTTLRNLEPDWILATGYTEDLLPMTVQMKELNVSAPMVTMIAAPAYREFVDGLGEDSDYITSASWWHNSVGYEADDIFGTSQNFSKLFEERWGEQADYPAASSATVGVLYQEAMEQCECVDPEGVRDALDDISVTTFFGPIEFGDNGQNIALDPPVFQIMDGEEIILHPEEIKTGELAYPMPDWGNR